MTKYITRRKALATGATSAGIIMGTACSKPDKRTPSKALHPPFLSSWSPSADLKRDLTPGTTPIRLAARTRKTDLNYPEDISITEMVKRIRDMGYTSTTARVNRGTKNPWLEAPESHINELKDALKTYDVTFFGLRAANNNIHPDLSERRKINKWVVEQCEATERMGGLSVTTSIGSCHPERAIAPHKDNWIWETWRLSVNVMKQILKDTAGMKVVLGIEALNMTNINNPRAHLQLIEDVGDPRCKITIDPANMINLGTYFRTTELLNECFDLLDEHIVVADAKDTYILPNKMSAYITQVPLGKGILDYETYLVRLSRLNNPITLLIEAHAEDEYPAAKKFIEETAAKAGVTIYS